MFFSGVSALMNTVFKVTQKSGNHFLRFLSQKDRYKLIQNKTTFLKEKRSYLRFLLLEIK